MVDIERFFNMGFSPQKHTQAPLWLLEGIRLTVSQLQPGQIITTPDLLAEMQKAGKCSRRKLRAALSTMRLGGELIISPDSGGVKVAESLSELLEYTRTQLRSRADDLLRQVKSMSIMGAEKFTDQQIRLLHTVLDEEGVLASDMKKTTMSDAVLSILNNPVYPRIGIRNSIPKKVLWNKVKLATGSTSKDDRGMRHGINILRHKGELVLSTGGIKGGYWMAANALELQTFFKREFMPRALTLLAQAAAMERTARSQFDQYKQGSLF